MSVNQEYFHLVLCTKYRERTINPQNKRHLYSYLYYLLKELGCYVKRINGMEEHVHILYDKNPKIATPDLARIVKSKSSHWARQSGYFPGFRGWCKEYFNVSKGEEQIPKLINYIINQEAHHQGESFLDEIKRLYAESGFAWNDKDFYE